RLFTKAGTRSRNKFFQSFLFLSTCSGFPLRPVDAMSSSSFLLMDSYMDLDAPLSSFTGVSPRVAERAAAGAAGHAGASHGKDEAPGWAGTGLAKQASP